MTSTVDSLEFSFDSQVINSKAYRRALANAKRRAEPDSAVEKPIPTMNSQTVSTIAAGLGIEEENPKVAGPSFLAEPPNNNNSPAIPRDDFPKRWVEHLKHSKANHQAPADIKTRIEPCFAAEKSIPTTDPKSKSTITARLKNEEEHSKVAGSSSAQVPNNYHPRSHICMICQRSYARVEHLKRHERSHTKGEPVEGIVSTRPELQHDSVDELEVIVSRPI
jgi:hypothetical protein